MQYRRAAQWTSQDWQQRLGREQPSCGRGLEPPFDVELSDLRIRVGEASNPGPSTDQRREVSSDDEPLLAPTQPPTQPVSGTLPTWVDSGRSHVPDTVWDESSRIRKSGSCRSGQFVQVKSIGDEISTEVLAWRLPFGTPGRFDRSRSGICSWGRCASESSLEALSASAKNAPSHTCSRGSGPQGEVEGEVHSVHAGSVGGSDFRKPAV